jgi:hypothetical protein
MRLVALQLRPRRRTALLRDVVWTAGRELNRSTYHLRAWNPVPRRLQFEGRIGVWSCSWPRCSVSSASSALSWAGPHTPISDSRRANPTALR